MESSKEFLVLYTLPDITSVMGPPEGAYAGKIAEVGTPSLFRILPANEVTCMQCFAEDMVAIRTKDSQENYHTLDVRVTRERLFGIYNSWEEAFNAMQEMITEMEAKSDED